MKKKKEMMYTIALRKRLSREDFFWKQKDFEFVECNINGHGRYWVADPFVFEDEGVLYVFYEAFDLVERKGKIGYSIIKDGIATDPKIVLDEAYHLSFPYIFRDGDEIYIMPESCGDYRVKLFRAVDFPNKWESAEILLPDAFDVDNIFIQSAGKNYLLVNERYHNPPMNKVSSCWVKNVLYPMKGYFQIIGEGCKVAEGEYGIRNAGKIIEDNGKIIRVGQNCDAGVYGKGLVFFEIESLEPYCEKVIYSIDYPEMDQHIRRVTKEQLEGVHTYNYSENYEVIDLVIYRPISKWMDLKRLCFLGWKHIRK